MSDPLSYEGQQWALWRLWAKEHGNIYVTGPHRSGTRIAAKMIANETGLRYVSEDEYDRHDPEAYRKMALRNGLVIQCPTALRNIADYANPAEQLGTNPDIPPMKPNLVIFMVRPLDQIHASEDRVQWPWEAHEMAKYACGRPMMKGPQFTCGEETDEPQVVGQPGTVSATTPEPAPLSADVKVWFWSNVIRPQIEKERKGRISVVEMSYNALKWHPLWVKKKDRAGWAWNQTE